MMEAIITTKFNIPFPRSKIVSRPHLIRKLEEGLWHESAFTRKLSLVSAPAGYGKTTLMAEWSQRMVETEPPPMFGQEPNLCWLSLEESDNDRVRFLTYFIAALKQVDEVIGATALGILQSPQAPPPEVYLATLVNDIASVPHPILFVLDDYHLIHTPSIHQMLNFIVEHQPRQMHLVILSREDPPLPLPRLRVRGEVRELRQEDLRFSIEEISHYLTQVIGKELDAPDLGALERRTEGWVAGLQLAALSMEGREDLSAFIRDFTGSNRYILDYLIEEVFRSQPEEIQEFLLRISILDRLSPALCDAVIGKTRSREILESLEYSNLFIVALDEVREWFRFHRLFVELLRHRLRISEEIEEAQLHRRASLWFEENGYPSEAVQHALMARDWDKSAELIQRYAYSLLKNGHLMTLIGWSEQIPEDVIHSHPDLCGDYAWALLLIGDLDKAEPYLSHAENYNQEDAQYQGGIASAQAYLARSRGDFAGTIEKSEKALALLPSEDFATRSIVAINLGLTYWHGGFLNQAEKVLREAVQSGEGSGNLYAAVAGRVFLGRTAASRGNLYRAEEMYQQILQHGGPTPMMALTHLDVCGLNYEWNKLDVAQEHWRQGMELSRRSGNVEFQIAAEMLQTRLKLAMGAIDAAEGAAVRAFEMSQEFSPFTQARCASSLVQVALAKGDLDTAVQWLDAMEVDGDYFTFYLFLNLTRARVLLAQGKCEEAASELATCYKAASEGGWGYAIVATRVMQCIAAENSEKATIYIKDALTLAQPEGYLRTFVDHGEIILPCLQEVAVKGTAVEYVGEILRAGGVKEASLSGIGLVEPLSEREIEVVRLLVIGLSNREIAAQLVLSLGTVKTHIHNIYGKLGVRNRAEAIARTRELELL